MNFRILEFNGESNHIHCLIEYPLVLSISKIFNHLKGVSSRNYKKAGHKMPSDSSLWTNSKFAVSVGGATIKTIKEYIESQNAPEYVARSRSPEDSPLHSQPEGRGVRLSLKLSSLC